MKRVAAARVAMFFGLWVVIDQSGAPDHLVVGALTALASARLSLHLLPPSLGQVRIGALLLLLPRFLWHSLRAGIDVALRAFHPRLPLEPGFVSYPVGLPRGAARNAFELIASLMPGSLPSAEGKHTIEFHCLDVQQPVLEEMAAEERAYARALLPGAVHD